RERSMGAPRHSGYESGACRPSAMAYLECRMERRVGPGGDAAPREARVPARSRQLMANEPLEKLGFKDLIDEKSEAKPEK
ncbi:Cytochrome c oxidase assembly protein COX19, partial [Cuculus canorus]